MEQRLVIAPNGKAFYLFSSGWSFLSNFAWAPFTIEGEQYETVEKYLQCERCEFYGNTELRAQLLKLRSPKLCKQTADKKIKPIKNSDTCFDVLPFLRRALSAKFTQNVKARQHLLATGEATIIFATTFDNWLGCGTALHDFEGGQPQHGNNVLGNVLKT